MNPSNNRIPAQLTVNDSAVAEPELQRNQLQSIRWNASTSMVRNDSMEGKKFLVVPMVMLAEGVHAGSNGPLYYPKSELGKTPEVWNHKPIVVYHPTKNGKPISACSPEVLTSSKIGIIMNTKFDKNGRLTAEAWLDEARVKKVDMRVWNAIEKKKTMELSTGLYTDNELEEGEFGGEEYQAIARNYRPDHLAVLPDQTGAFSVKDGGGFIRNQIHVSCNLNADEMETVHRKVIEVLKSMEQEEGSALSKVLANEISFEQIRSLIYSALALKYPSDKGYACPYIEGVYDDHFIYCMGGKTFKLGYSKTDSGVKLTSGDPTEVVRIIEYKDAPASNTGPSNPTTITNKTHIDMNKAQMVADLIANHGYSKDDEKELMGMDEKALSKMLAAGQAVANKAKPKEGDPSINKETAKPKEEPEKAPVTLAAPSIDKVLSPDQLQALNYGQRMLTENKKRLVSTITGNANNRFTEAQLNAMDIDMLEHLAALAGPSKEEVDSTAPSGGDFAAFGGARPVPANNATEKEVLVREQIQWGKKAG